MWASGVKASGGWVATPSRFKAKLITTPQTVATATWVKVLFNSSDYDALSEFDDSVNNRFDAANDGVYHFDATLFIETPGTANPIEVMFQVNGAGFWSPSDSRQGVATVSHNRVTLSGDFNLSAGDYVEVWMHHYAGVNKDIEVDSVFSGHRVA